ncbi:hypothetical protein SAMN05421734_102473 [Pelagirhabdus alkalitolerans]|uniref:Short-chain dehydrogenase n=1 Tax=Pelagirhabdus alkalitolerans TaxID=1612202 RepID=A0A1G6HCM3_9BACI|nr:SDR family oxidoreductase [Pelagirhabdus alkalitolerans]SDB91828.1 hypothetical protein SAMN05421734_102473 [Pelagirhabdus alkalitolerans]
MTKLSNKTIVITGATSGIGLSLTKQLANDSVHLILISRSEDKLKQLKHSIDGDNKASCSIYQADLTDVNQASNVMKQVMTDHETIDALVNNAGVGYFELAHKTPTEKTEQMFQLNVLSLIEITKEIIPLFLKHKKGHVVNIASFSGKIATPKASTYSATKHAVLGYTDALRLELNLKELYVTAVNLGPVRTAFFNQADPTGSYQRAVEKFMLDPDIVSKKIKKALFTNKREINLPFWMSVGAKLHDLFPRTIERLMGPSFNKK